MLISQRNRAVKELKEYKEYAGKHLPSVALVNELHARIQTLASDRYRREAAAPSEIDQLNRRIGGCGFDGHQHSPAARHPTPPCHCMTAPLDELTSPKRNHPKEALEAENARLRRQSNAIYTAGHNGVVPPMPNTHDRRELSLALVKQVFNLFGECCAAWSIAPPM